MKTRLGVKDVSRMGGLPTLEIPPRRIRQQYGQKDQQYENRRRRTAREQSALEHEVVDNEGGQLRGDAGAPTRQRADEIESGDGELQLDDDNGHRDRPKRGENDTPIHTDRPG